MLIQSQRMAQNKVLLLATLCTKCSTHTSHNFFEMYPRQVGIAIKTHMYKSVYSNKSWRFNFGKHQEISICWKYFWPNKRSFIFIIKNLEVSFRKEIYYVFGCYYNLFTILIKFGKISKILEKNYSNTTRTQVQQIFPRLILWSAPAHSSLFTNWNSSFTENLCFLFHYHPFLFLRPQFLETQKKICLWHF